MLMPSPAPIFTIVLADVWKVHYQMSTELRLLLSSYKVVQIYTFLHVAIAALSDERTFS